MVVIKYNLMNLQGFGIPAKQFIELADFEQFEEGRVYNIGLLRDNELVDEQKCTKRDYCISYSKELWRIYGKDSEVYFYEDVPATLAYLFEVISKEEYSVDVPFVDETEKEVVEGWISRLSAAYDFREPIRGTISRDNNNRLFISSIT